MLIALSVFVVILFSRNLNLKILLVIYQCEKKKKKRVAEVFLCQAERALARPLPFCLAQLCATQRADVYIMETRNKKTEERREKMRELFSLSLFRRTLIVNVEDRRQSRNNGYEEEKQGRRRRKCNRFPASDRTRKISLNMSNRMVVAMVSPIVCVGCCFDDQLQHIYESSRKERERQRENEHMEKKGYCILSNCYSSFSHHNQF